MGQILAKARKRNGKSRIPEIVHALEQEPAFEAETYDAQAVDVSSLIVHESKSETFVRFVCISDTHSKTDNLNLPEGDVLIHSGDFTELGLPEEIAKFDNFLAQLRERYEEIIVIAGNHEMTFQIDNHQVRTELMMRTPEKCPALEDPEFDPRRLLKNCTYIEDEEVLVQGYKIYGAPWQPGYGGWAFNVRDKKGLQEKWDKIPSDTEILITHGPPRGHGDLCISGRRAGCTALLHTVQTRVKPRMHVFGHVHEGYGASTDGTTIFVNASICTNEGNPDNPPIVFDLPRKYLM